MKKFLVLGLVVMFFGCTSVSQMQLENYCIRMERERPDEILQAVREGQLVKGMNDKEAMFFVKIHYQGHFEVTSYKQSGNDIRVKTVWTKDKKRGIKLTFENKVLNSWSKVIGD